MADGDVTLTNENIILEQGTMHCKVCGWSIKLNMMKSFKMLKKKHVCSPENKLKFRVQRMNNPEYMWLDIECEAQIMAKQKYDESKDETIAIMGLQANATTQFEVRVMKYDGGEKKLQLRRMYLDTNATWQYSYKLGRFKKDELMAVIRLMTAIAPHFNIMEKEYGNEFELIGAKKPEV